MIVGVGLDGSVSVTFWLGGGLTKVGATFAPWEFFSDWKVIDAAGTRGLIALDTALRMGIERRFPNVHDIHLVNYRVRILEGVADTGAVVRVLIDSTDGDRTWTTIGVDANVIEASWQALVDSVDYKLRMDERRARQLGARRAAGARRPGRGACAGRGGRARAARHRAARRAAPRRRPPRPAPRSPSPGFPRSRSGTISPR